VPRNAISSCLSQHGSLKSKSEYQIDLLLSRCNGGVDTVHIIDDGGGLTKTVSVEDSFIRDSLTSLDLLKEKIETLIPRLLRLLDQRKESSQIPKIAYPTSLRLTLRFVDNTLQNSRMRPFRSMSKQQPINGKILMWEHDRLNSRISVLRSSTTELLNILLASYRDNLNITRMNLAVTAFADVLPSQNKSLPDSNNQMSLSRYFTKTKYESASTPKSENIKDKVVQNIRTKCTNKSLKRTITDISSNDATTIKSLKTPHVGIDPSVLAALPADMVDEILRNQTLYQLQSRYTERKNPSRGIESFFKKKK